MTAGSTSSMSTRVASEPPSRNGRRTELIGVESLAAWLGVEVVFVRRLVAERRIPFVKIGKFVRFDPDEISVWIDGQRVGTVTRNAARRSNNSMRRPTVR